MNDTTITGQTSNENTTNGSADPAAKAYDYKFEKVSDRQGNPIEGLWIRNGKYYFQTYLPGKGTRRIPLLNDRQDPVANVSEAKAAITILKNNKRSGEMPLSHRSPKFADYVTHYLETVTKDPKSIAREKGSFKQWAAHLGDIRLSQIRLEHITSYQKERQDAGKSNRTINCNVIALSNLLNLARDENWLSGELPTEKRKALKEDKKKRSLVTKETLELVIAEALKKEENGAAVYPLGQAVADWLRLMACCGARNLSALSAQWSDVDWDNRQLHICRNTKFKKHMIVDFNDGLEAHLRDMHARRDKASDYMFPSRFETVGPGHMMGLQDSLTSIRNAAGFPTFNAHDLRHQFISYCVMDGIDFMTIAKWVGHSDGGVLIGKVYGHLHNEHTKKAAEKVTLGKGGKAAKLDPQVVMLQAQLKQMQEMMTAQAELMKQLAAKAA